MASLKVDTKIKVEIQINLLNGIKILYLNFLFNCKNKNNKKKTNKITIIMISKKMKINLYKGKIV